MEAIIGYLFEPFSFTFMQRGLAAAVMVGIVGGVIGCYVVLKGMAFLGDALAHAILPGIAIAYISGQALFWGAIIAGILSAVGISFLSRQERFKEDTSIGVIFAAMFGLGIALLNHTLVAVGKPDYVLTPERLQEAYGGQLTVFESDEARLVVPHTHGECC